MMNVATMNFSPSECSLFSEDGGKDHIGYFDIVNTPSQTFYAKPFKYFSDGIASCDKAEITIV